jgi:hypothetical protein
MIAALSSMFSQAVKRGKMLTNLSLGMDKAHQADPNANRELVADELKFVRENAPMEVLIPVMLARYAGLRGQTIVVINRKQFKEDQLTGQAVRYCLTPFHAEQMKSAGPKKPRAHSLRRNRCLSVAAQYLATTGPPNL